MTRLIILALLLASPAFADYSQHPRADEFVNEMLASGLYQREEVLSLLRAAKKRPELVAAEQKAPEKTKTWPDYQAIFLQPWRIQQGVEFIREHADSFARAEARYGVPASLISAIIGVETRFGGYTGPHRILDSLATQGFDHPTRSAFFYSELKAFFLLCKERGFDPLALKGSYAGAMGLPQFMPSNYRRLAVDFDQDGKIDLWSPADAIGSAAHYLSAFLGQGRDWQSGEAVAFPLPQGPSRPLPSNQKQPHDRWGKVKAVLGHPALPLADSQKVGLLALEHGDRLEYWLAMPNFYSIMSYNPRVYYAMAVYQLSQAIAQARQTHG